MLRPGNTRISIADAEAALSGSVSVDQGSVPGPEVTAPPASAPAQSAPTTEDGNTAIDPSTDPNDDQDQEPMEALAQSTESTEEDNPAEAAPSASLGGFTREEDVPEGLRPMWRSAQGDITRKQQEVAEARRQVEAQRAQLAQAADLAEGIRALGLDPAETAEMLRQARDNPSLLQQQAPQQWEPATDPSVADPLEALYAQDAALQRLLAIPEDDIASTAESVLLQNSIEDRKQRIQHAHEQAQQTAWQQQQARSQAVTSELSRLEADATLKPHLTDPQRKNSLLQYATRGEVPLEVVAKGLSFDDALSRATAAAYKQGQQDARQNLDRIRGASVQQGRPTPAADPHYRPKYEKGKGLMGMYTEAVENGLIKPVAQK